MRLPEKRLTSSGSQSNKLFCQENPGQLVSLFFNSFTSLRLPTLRVEGRLGLLHVLEDGRLLLLKSTPVESLIPIVDLMKSWMKPVPATSPLPWIILGFGDEEADPGNVTSSSGFRVCFGP